MSRRPVLAAVTALLLLAPASSARANPAITVDSAMLPGSTSSLPLTARHVLTLTAGAAPERLTVSVNPTVKLTVVNATVERPTAATGPSLTTCPGRWNRIRRHHVFRTANPHEAEATFTIAAGQTATVTADATIVRTPFDDDTPDAEWSIEPAQGGPFTIVSAAPGVYEGPLGVSARYSGGGREYADSVSTCGTLLRAR